MATAEWAELSERVVRLERRGRRSRRVNAALASGMIALVTMAATNGGTRQGTLEAEQVIIRDREGKIHARFGLLPPGPGGLWAIAHSEEDAEKLLTTPTPGLILYGPEEKPRVEARAVGSLAFVSIYGPDGRTGGTFGLDKAGSGLSLFGERRRATLRVGGLGGRLEFDGEPGTAGLTLLDQPAGALMLKDEKGNLRIMLGPGLRDPKAGKAASLVTLDETGNLLFAAP